MNNMLMILQEERNNAIFYHLIVTTCFSVNLLFVQLMISFLSLNPFRGLSYKITLNFLVKSIVVSSLRKLKIC